MGRGSVVGVLWKKRDGGRGGGSRLELKVQDYGLRDTNKQSGATATKCERRIV